MSSYRQLGLHPDEDYSIPTRAEAERELEEHVGMDITWTGRTDAPIDPADTKPAAPVDNTDIPF